MIMDLPEEFSIGNAWQKNDAFRRAAFLARYRLEIPHLRSFEKGFRLGRKNGRYGNARPGRGFNSCRRNNRDRRKRR